MHSGATDDVGPPDGPLSAEQQAIASLLSPEFVARIDAALLGHARPHWRKVAMVVGLTMRDSSLRIPGLPDIFYAQRVKDLVSRGLLVADGNLEFMRYSEVRLSAGTHEP